MNLYRLNGVTLPAPRSAAKSSNAADPSGTSILRRFAVHSVENGQNQFYAVLATTKLGVLVKLIKISSLVLILVGLSAARSSGGTQSPARPKIDVSKLGPQVGERVPDFRLNDQNGKTWTLQSVMGSKGAMLVFVRSADW